VAQGLALLLHAQNVELFQEVYLLAYLHHVDEGANRQGGLL
jgi:hypothetical protein